MARAQITELKLVKQGPFTEDLGKNVASVIYNYFYGEHGAEHMAAFKAEMAKKASAACAQS